METRMTWIPEQKSKMAAIIGILIAAADTSFRFISLSYIRPVDINTSLPIYFPDQKG